MKKNPGCGASLWVLLAASLMPVFAQAAGDRIEGFPSSADGSTTGQYTGFTNTGSIINTRHNLTQSTLSNVAGGASAMNQRRNDYGEVCVYCHTPHAAESSGKAPLWNRNLPAASSYTTYTTLNSSTMTQTVNAPGGGSLPCLSCHDGTQAVDAILNMPGSGGYNTSTSDANLSLWRPDLTGMAGAKSFSHYKLNAATSGASCLSCHSPNVDPFAVDFTVSVIGTDLRNDHPVGVTFPATTGGATDWKTPTGTRTVGSFTTKYFDENSNGRMDKGDIRLYDSGNGASVECASCHDPHGVTGSGGSFNRTFLRKTNSASAVCLTCHAK